MLSLMVFFRPRRWTKSIQWRFFCPRQQRRVLNKRRGLRTQMLLPANSFWKAGDYEGAHWNRWDSSTYVLVPCFPHRVPSFQKGLKVAQSLWLRMAMILPCNLEFPRPNTFSNEAKSFRGYIGPFFWIYGRTIHSKCLLFWTIWWIIDSQNSIHVDSSSILMEVWHVWHAK